MLFNLARLDLAERRKSLLFYPLGMALYTMTIVALFPSFHNDSSLAKLTEGNEKLLALFGASGPLTSPAGWLNGNLYGNFVPLVMLLVAIGYGANSLAGQNEKGTLGLVATLPVSRTQLVGTKIVVLYALCVPIALVTFVGAVVGRSFALAVPMGALIGVTVAVTLLGGLFGAMAMFVGATTASRGSALGVTSGVAVVAYLISSLAPAIPWIFKIRWISPFWWSTGAGQVSTGISVLDGLALFVTTVLFGLATVQVAKKMDIR